MTIIFEVNGHKFTDHDLQKKGIVIPGLMGQMPANALAEDGYGWAMDAQPTLITTSNAGIPQYLANWLDPKLIEVLVTPMNATKILGPDTKKGDWTLDTAQFPVIESSGETTSYGDYNEGGSVSANVNWPTRQSYIFQTMTQWGERELDRMGLARIDWASRLNIASALTMAKFMNKSYFFGIDGLTNYGLLNDPDLPAPIAPAAGAWASLDAAAIFTDVRRLVSQLISQSKGLVTRETPMVLALSPEAETNFTKTNIYNVNVTDQIKKNFPNLRIETAVEYDTESGELMQVIAESLEGQVTAECAFNEKMRAHPIIVQSSSYKQKKTGGTWGTIIYRPFLVAGMLGI